MKRERGRERGREREREREGERERERERGREREVNMNKRYKSSSTVHNVFVTNFDQAQSFPVHQLMIVYQVLLITSRLVPCPLDKSLNHDCPGMMQHWPNREREHT